MDFTFGIPPNPPLPLSTPCSPYVVRNIAIYRLQVMASELGIETGFLAKHLLLEHI